MAQSKQSNTAATADLTWRDITRTTELSFFTFYLLPDLLLIYKSAQLI